MVMPPASSRSKSVIDGREDYINLFCHISSNSLTNTTRVIKTSEKMVMNSSEIPKAQGFLLNSGQRARYQSAIKQLA